MREWLSLAAVVGLAAVASWGCDQPADPSVEDDEGTTVKTLAKRPAESLTETPDDTPAESTAETPSKPPPSSQWPDDPSAPVTVALLGTVGEIQGPRWGSRDGRFDFQFGGNQTKCQLTVRLPAGGHVTVPVRGSVIMRQKDTVVESIAVWPLEQPGPLADVVAAVEQFLKDNDVSLDDKSRAVVDEWKTATADKVAPQTPRFEVVPDEQSKMSIGVTEHGSEAWGYSLSFKAEREALVAKIHDVAAAWCLKPTFVLERSGHRAIFSPDGKSLAIGADLWDIESKKKVAELRADPYVGDIVDVRFSSDGTRLAFVHVEAVRIWGIESRKLVRETTAENTTFRAISPDLSQVLAFPNEESVEVWSVEKGTREASLDKEKRDVGRVRFSATGQIVLLPRHGGATSVWEAKSGKQLFVCTETNHPSDGVFSTDGKMLLTGASQAIDAYDTGSGNHLFQIRTWASHCLAISADGKYLAGGTWAVGGVESVEVYDVAKQERIAELGKLDETVHTVDFSRDGRWLAAALSGGSVPVWDLTKMTRGDTPDQSTAETSTDTPAEKRVHDATESPREKSAAAMDAGALVDAIIHDKPELAKQLIEAGADVNGSNNKRGVTPLHTAALKGYAQIAELLIAKGAEIDSRDNVGKTPLHSAAIGGDAKVAKLLLDSSAAADAKDKGGNTPLHFTASAELAELLIERDVDVNSRSEWGRAPLHQVAESGRAEVATLLLEKGAELEALDDLGRTPLHLAGRKPNVAEILVAKGADVNASSEGGATPLFSAYSLEVADLLIERGAKINARAESGQTPLFDFMQTDEGADTAKLLIGKGADVNAVDTRGTTPLHRAAAYGSSKQVELLLSNGAEVNGEDDSGKSPLRHAIDRKQDDVVAILKQHGAVCLPPVEPPTIDVSEEGKLLLAAAGKGEKETVTELLAQGVDVNTVDADGDTPLHKAVRAGHVEMVKLLLSSGANANAVGTTKFGGTPLHCATHIRDISRAKEVAQVLLDNGADANAEANDGRSPLHSAANRDVNADLVELLLTRGAKVDARDKLGWAPLHTAVSPSALSTAEKELDVPRLLLENGADVNGKSDSGVTPLGRALCVEFAEFLIANGADVNARDIYGRTPLHKECGSGPDIDHVALLLDKGAQIDTRGDLGRTPLHFVASSNRNVEVARLLVNKGAEVDAKTDEGKTPMHLAAGFGCIEMIKLLVEHGANVNTRDESGRTPLHGTGSPDAAKLLLEHGAEVNARDDTGTTPLLKAAEGKSSDRLVKIAKLLIEAGANVNTANNDGWTPLHWFADGEAEFVELLIAKGAEVNAPNCEGRTPSHNAASYGNTAVVRLFIKHGADVNAKCDRGETPLSRALEKKHEAMAALLKEHDAAE